MSSRVAQNQQANFKHEKSLWDRADSWSLRKRNAEKCKNFEIGPRLGVAKWTFVFYYMLQYQRFWSITWGSKKYMKELDQPLNFLGRTYWDFLDSPKKFWCLGAPPPMGPGTPKQPQISLFGGPGYHRGWGPQTPKFFWEVQEVPIGPPGKIKGLVQLFHVFF